MLGNATRTPDHRLWSKRAMWQRVKLSGKRVSRPVRILSAYKEYSLRRQVARSVAGASRFDIAALREQGFVGIDPPAPLLASLLEACRDKHDRESEFSQSRKKAFFSQLLDADDYALDGVAMKFALDETILEAVADYLGYAPYLESVELLYSKPGRGDLSASQLWHQDETDRAIVKVFVYIHDVEQRNGPLTLLPIPAGRRLPRMIPHRLTDEQIEHYCPESEIVACKGPAGTTVMIDTQNCWHYGSRCEEPRLAYVVYYTSGFGFRPPVNTWPISVGEAAGLSTIQKLAPRAPL